MDQFVVRISNSFELEELYRVFGFDMYGTPYINSQEIIKYAGRKLYVRFNKSRALGHSGDPNTYKDATYTIKMFFDSPEDAFEYFGLAEKINVVSIEEIL